MSVSTIKETKCSIIQIMKDKGYVNKLYYFTVLCYCGSSHWSCFEKKKLVKNSCSEICQVKLAAKIGVKFLAKYI